MASNFSEFVSVILKLNEQFKKLWGFAKCRQPLQRNAWETLTISCNTLVASTLPLTRETAAQSRQSVIIHISSFPGLCIHLVYMAETCNSSPFSLDELVHIFHYLPPESLAKCSQVCRDWCQAAQVGSLWKRHCLQRWNFCHLGKLKPGG